MYFMVQKITKFKVGNGSSELDRHSGSVEEPGE
jgi:hypothetical protein